MPYHAEAGNLFPLKIRRGEHRSVPVWNASGVVQGTLAQTVLFGPVSPTYLPQASNTSEAVLLYRVCLVDQFGSSEKCVEACEPVERPGSGKVACRGAPSTHSQLRLPIPPNIKNWNSAWCFACSRISRCCACSRISRCCARFRRSRLPPFRYAWSWRFWYKP